MNQHSEALSEAMKMRQLAIAMLVLAAALVYLAVLHRGLAWLLLYPAFSFAACAVAYLGAGPRLFGKRGDGKRAWWAYLLLGPYLALTWLLWWIGMLLAREPAVQVAPSVWISRRPRRKDIPEGVDMILDLTAEFPPVHAGRRYRCLPLLDASAGELPEVARAVREAANSSSPLIHCAQGHGRTAMVAAAVLLARDEAQTVQEALERVWAVRPWARPNAGQRAMLAAIATELRRATAST